MKEPLKREIFGLTHANNATPEVRLLAAIVNRAILDAQRGRGKI